MPLPIAVDQENLFYTAEWTREVDSVFIKGLIEQTIVGNPVDGGLVNRRAIAYCRDRVNGHFVKDFTYRTCVDRLRKLYTRYLLFTSIISRPGVQHHYYTNVVTADDATWDVICRKNDLGAAYIERGEEEYENLCFIFNSVSDKVNPRVDMVEVIHISSDTDNISMSDGGEVIDAD